MSSQQNLAERSMAIGLRALGRLASSDLVDRLGLRQPTERFLHGASKTTAADRRERRPHVRRRPEAVAPGAPAPGDANRSLRPDADRGAADAARVGARLRARQSCGPPPRRPTRSRPRQPSCWPSRDELGLTMVGVPEELGGAVEERSAVTSVLISEALALGRHGDRASPAWRRPASRPRSGCGATPTSRPPTSRRSSARTSPAAALAMLEPRALFDPFDLHTRAREAERRLRARRASSRSSRARSTASCSSSPPSSPDTARRCSSSSPGRPASASSPSPAMGIRAAATGRLTFEDVQAARRPRCSATPHPRSTATASRSAGSAGARSPSAPARPCSTT